MKDKLIGDLWVKHLAVIADVQKFGSKRAKNTLFQEQSTSENGPRNPQKLFSGARRQRYYLCECMFCGRQYVVRSDYLYQKKCKC